MTITASIAKLVIITILVEIVNRAILEITEAKLGGKVRISKLWYGSYHTQFHLVFS